MPGLRSTVSGGASAPVTVSVVVNAPRADVYAPLETLENHVGFPAHMFSNWSFAGARSGVSERRRAVTRVVISQPMLFPWVGLFEQIRAADVYVHYDDVQFSKGSFTNRVQIKTARGPRWLTVPGASVHVYGKGEARAGRKMGHVTRVWPAK